MRVIAGTLGGRRLRAPPGRGTRPTTDRVREALFSILGNLEEQRVLDLYAGSGALGIEALSRGATHAVFVEQAKPALTALRDNLHALGLEQRSDVLGVGIERTKARLSQLGPFDLVLCDPPWAELDEAVRNLGRALPGCLEAGSRLVLEHAAGAEPQLPASLGLGLSQRRQWGDSGASFFRQIASESP